MPKPWMFWAVLAAAVALAWLSAAPPSPRPASAPADQFSAERAMADVRGMARAPHPIGSAEHARVRDYLAGRLRALGLTVEILGGADLRATDEGVVGANVSNIVGVSPGTDPKLPALALMAHYDSVPGSPGAADDASGVAAILETVRAIRARGPVKRDLIVLLTDGEETGLFGAITFWRDQPLARRVGLVINLEARGSSGPAFMFETGPENAGAIRLYGDQVRRPEASSLSGWVYDRMPNGTDFTIPKKVGLTGYNIAMIGRPFDYHSASALPTNLDRASLQHMGDQALGLADTLARAAIPPERGEDLVYSEVFGRWLIAYPGWGGWLVLALAAGLIAVAVRAQGLPERRLDLARGAGMFLLVLSWSALGLRCMQLNVPVGEDFYQSSQVAQFGLYFAAMALCGGGFALAAFALVLKGRRRWFPVVFALLLGAACSARVLGFDLTGTVLAVLAAGLSAVLMGRPLSSDAAAQGMLLAGLVLAAVLQALAAEIAFLVAWPLLAAASAAVLLAIDKGPVLARQILAALIAALGVGWTLRMTGFLFDGLGMTNAELLGLFAALTAMVVAPFAAAYLLHARYALGVMAMLAVALGLILVTALREPWSARTPAPSHVMHVADGATGASRLISAREDIDPWSRAVLAAEGRVRSPGDEPLLHIEQAWSVPARAIPAPGLAAITLSREGDRVVITIPASGVRDLRLTLTPTVAAKDVTVQGRPAESLLKPGKATRLRWHAPGQALRLAFRPAGPGQITVGWAAVRDGWPAAAQPLPARPADVMPTGSSDTSVVTGQTTLSW